MRVLFGSATLLVVLLLGATTNYQAAEAQTTLTPLQKAINAKEAALQTLSSDMKVRYSDRCMCYVQPGNPAAAPCSVPACGNDITNDNGFTCTSKLGNSTELCGPDCVGMRRNLKQTTVHFPPKANFTDQNTQTFVCASAKMDSTFQNNFDLDHAKAWSYVADRKGSFRVFPGLPSDRTKDTCSNYDPRLRPWYIEATSGPKDVIFLLDVGPNMIFADKPGSSQSKLDLAKNSIKQVIATMTENDYVGIVTYSGSTAELVDSVLLNAASSLVQVTEENRKNLLKALDDQQVKSSATADYSSPFAMAFAVLKRSSNNGKSSKCTSVILSMMDSKPSDGTLGQVASTVVDGQKALTTVGNVGIPVPIPNNRTAAHIFAYTMASTNNETVLLAKALACAHQGLYDMLDLSDSTHFTNMAEYYHFLGLKSASAGATVRWSLPYEDAFGLGQMVTGARLVIDGQQNQIAVAAMDVTLEELETHGETYNVVMAELKNRGSQCPSQQMDDCLMQKLRADSRMGYVCPTLPSVATCISQSKLKSEQAECGTFSANNLNDLLCEKLNANTRLSAAATTPSMVKSNQNVSCCSTFETCPANLWEGPLPVAQAGKCDPSAPGVVVAVVGDWSQGSPVKQLTSDIVADALPKYLVDLRKTGNQSCDFEMVLIDAGPSGGGQTKAMHLYEDEIVTKRGLTQNLKYPSLINNKTLVVIVQGDSELVEAVLHYVDTTIPVLVSKAADFWIADEALWPNAVTLMPSGSQLADALLAATISFKWDSVGILYPKNSQYGFSMQQNVNKIFTAAGAKFTQPAPVVVSTVKMTGGDITAADARAALLALMENSPVGIIAFVTPEQYQVLASVKLAMATEYPIIGNFFFILPSDCVGSESISSSALTVNSPFATKFSLPYGVVSQTTQSTMGLRSFGSISTLFDAVRTMYLAFGPEASGTTVARRQDTKTLMTAFLVSKIVSVTFADGFTGQVSFDAVDQARSAPTSVLFFNTNSIMKPVGKWSGLSGFYAVAGMVDWVPKSPLKVVTVCLMSTDACHDVTNVDHMIYAFRMAAAQNQFFLDNNVKVNTLAMRTGMDAVSGMRRLLVDAHRCNFVTGPGLSGVGFALTPIINAYKIPQLDYSATSTAFVDKSKFPFFSRTVPSDAPVAQVYSEVVRGFKWDRVLLMTTKDEYGRHMASSVLAEMQNLNIDVEDTQYVVPSPEGVVNENPYLAPLTKINSESISRIVLVLMPIDSTNAKIFLRTAHKDLGMDKTHIFIFGDVFCQNTDAEPALREAFIGSLCIRPFVNSTMFDHVAADYKALANSVKIPKWKQTAKDIQYAKDRVTQNAILKAGGFDTVPKCDMGHTDMYSPYAFDAAQVVLDVIERALTTRVSLTNGTALVNLLRATELTCNGIHTFWDVKMNMSMADSNHFMSNADMTLMPTTGNLSFARTGNRIGAAFTVNVQQQWPTAVVEFASWDSKTGIYTMYDVADLPYGPLRWLDNTTTLPKVTTRSIGFIASQTVRTHPGTIILSLFGFIATLCVFGFCYKHQKLRQDEDEIDMVEEEMGGVAVPSEYPERPENYTADAPTFTMAQPQQQPQQ